MVGPAVSLEVLGLSARSVDAAVSSLGCVADPRATTPASRSSASRRWGTAAKYASSASSTKRVARAPTSLPAAVMVTIRARASLGSGCRDTRPARSSRRSTWLAVFTSIPAWVATITWLAPSPCSSSHCVQARRTNWECVSPTGSRAAAMSRCQASAALHMRKPGLASGPWNLVFTYRP